MRGLIIVMSELGWEQVRWRRDESNNTVHQLDRNQCRQASISCSDVLSICQQRNNNQLAVSIDVSYCLLTDNFDTEKLY